MTITIEGTPPLTVDELEQPLAISEWSTIANCISIAITVATEENTIRELAKLYERAIYRRDALSHGRVMP